LRWIRPDLRDRSDDRPPGAYESVGRDYEIGGAFAAPADL
jgi:hypothetical protein